MLLITYHQNNYHHQQQLILLVFTFQKDNRLGSLDYKSLRTAHRLSESYPHPGLLYSFNSSINAAESNPILAELSYCQFQ
jgi:hypothetical protein